MLIMRLTKWRAPLSSPSESFSFSSVYRFLLATLFLLVALSWNVLAAEEDSYGEEVIKRDAFFIEAVRVYAQSKPAQAGKISQALTPQAPLTAKEKFKYALHHGFIDPGAFIRPLGGAAIAQLWHPWGGPNKRAGDKVVDTFSRGAMNYGYSASRHMFGSFVLATVFKQDPRYKPARTHGFKARLLHAVTRVVVTEGDNGKQQFNISRVGGTLAASGLSNVWNRDKDVGVSHTFERLGTSLGFDALGFALKEFGPEIKKKILRK